MNNIEVKDTVRLERVGAHSHITGLGLNERLEPQDVGDGMVGQSKARRAAGIIVKMVQVGLEISMFALDVQFRRVELQVERFWLLDHRDQVNLKVNCLNFTRF